MCFISYFVFLIFYNLHLPTAKERGPDDRLALLALRFLFYGLASAMRGDRNTTGELQQDRRES